MHINRAAVAEIGIAPDLIEQDFAGEDAIRGRGERDQQVEPRVSMKARVSCIPVRS